MTNSRQISTLVAGVGVVLILLGCLARVAPLLNEDNRVLRQWPTEDGYLMLTIARNMAIGNGMSTADGELPTNGTQPLATGVWSLAFMAVDADKEAGVFVVLCIELVLSLVAVFLLFNIARRIFQEIDVAPGWALLVAGLWYANGNTVGHSMNALESGLYTVLVLLFVSVCQSLATRLSDSRARLPWVAAGSLSLILAVCFYARNDAAVLIAAFCATFVLFGWGSATALKDRFIKSICIGLGTIVISLPWLIFNVTEFGHIMPISGVAQSAAVHFGNNAYLLPIVWAEYLSIVLPVPQAVEGSGLVVAILSVLVTGIVIALVMQLSKLPRNTLFIACMIAGYAALLSLYYGLIHGAPWFMDRYLYPISPFLAIAVVAAIARLVHGAALERFALPVTACGICGAVIVCIAMQWRIYEHGAVHQHQQVVNWVEQNVSDETWVGAVQTGTLGFFHDRTINLDGKVNPEALDAVLEQRIPSYVVEKQIVVLADWFGIHTWMQYEPIERHFNVLVADEDNNLSVLGRKDFSPTVRMTEVDSAKM